MEPTPVAPDAHAPEAAPDDRHSEKYLSFVTGDEVYALPIGDVAEIISLQRIIPVPTTPSFIRGLINLRGAVIPVVDVRQRLGLPPVEPGDRSCIVVVRTDDEEIGLLVDSVSEVLEMRADQIQPAARSSSAPASTAFARGLGLVDGAVRVVLDSKRLLYAGRPADATAAGERTGNGAAGA